VSGVAFATTTDTGALAAQARLLARSVRAVHPDAPLLVTLPAESAGDLDPAVRDELDRLATVVVEPYPLPEYPISAQLRAFELAAARFDADRTVMLDTDTLLLGPFDPPALSAPLAARQASIRTTFWGSAASTDAWARVYDRYGVAPPDADLRGAIDGQPIAPYWNAGVVVAEDPALPGELLALTRDLATDPPGVDEDFFTDQVALAVLAARHGLDTLSDRYNYPLLGHVGVPDDVRVLHYSARFQLRRLWGRARSRVRAATKEDPGWPSPGDLLQAGLTLGSAHAGRVLSYERAERVRAAVRGLTQR
jgi:hypothetical protein